jgi:hypothetical protein
LSSPSSPAPAFGRNPGLALRAGLSAVIVPMSILLAAVVNRARRPARRLAA